LEPTPAVLAGPGDNPKQALLAANGGEVNGESSQKENDQAESGKYKKLDPISEDFLIFVMKLHYDEIQNILDAIERSRNDPERLQALIDRWRMIFEKN